MKILKSICLVLLSLWLTSSGCTNRTSDHLMLAVAANMQFLMPELVEAFEKRTSIETEWTASSSGKITAQIKSGANFHLFMSADLKYPTELDQSGYTLNEPKVYAHGRLVLWSINHEAEITFLTDSQADHIAIANPAIAPYGEAAMEALTSLGIYEEIKHKLVYGESISQTNQFITTGAAQIGITAKSTLMASGMTNSGSWIDLDQNVYTPITQAVVVLKGNKEQQEKAMAFFTFLFSDQAKEILNKFGYTVPH